MRGERARVTVPPVRMLVRRRPRLSWLQAVASVTAVTALVVLTAAVLVTLTDPGRFRDLPDGLWWAVTTFTTVGYGDMVPASAAGRLVAAVLMLLGVGCFAFLTAVAASAIVVGEVGGEERIIERGEREIERVERLILARLNDIDRRLERLDRLERLERPERPEPHSAVAGPDGEVQVPPPE